MHNDKNLVQTQLHNQYSFNDEIDLIELAQQLWQRKTIITVITIIFVLIASLYVAFHRPLYKSTVTILKNTDFTSLITLQRHFDLVGSITNTHDIKSSSINTNDLQTMLFNMTVKAVNNPAIKQKILKQSGLMAVYLSTIPEEPTIDQSLFILDDHLKVTIKNQDTITLEFTNEDERMAQEFLNRWLLQAIKQYVYDQLEHKKEQLYNNVVQNIHRQIAYHENKFIADNKSQILQLQDQLQIAINNHIKKAQLNNLSSVSGLTFLLGSDIITQFNNLSSVSELTFLLGSDIIKEKLTLAKAQIDRYKFISMPTVESKNKPTLASISSLKSLLNTLKAKTIVFDPISSLDLVQLQQPATMPDDPEGPNPPVIIIISLMLGMMLGIFSALIQISIQKRKLSAQSSSDSNEYINKDNITSVALNSHS